ncbi:MAG TPA: DUF2147 domain-containing protein [Vineibacter sp.]|nr:DUF2147 domain-containing protein [Vineibacter sp.]
MRGPHLHGSLILSTVVAAGLLSLPAMAQSPQSAPERGRWLTESGNLEIEIAPCGAALCGTVVKVIANRSMSDPGKTMADGPSPMGMKILSDFKPANGQWQGHILNRETGKNFDCLMSLQGTDQLKIHAYVGTPETGKTQIWRRVAAAAQ